MSKELKEMTLEELLKKLGDVKIYSISIELDNGDRIDKLEPGNPINSLMLMLQGINAKQIKEIHIVEYSFAEEELGGDRE